MLFGRRERAVHRLLIVEDEPLVAFDNEHFLTSIGYHVVGTLDAALPAIALLAAEPVDLVIADVKLTLGGSGIDVARAAHERDIPVLFAAGHCPIDAQQLAYGCLAKPYSQRDLRAAIEAIEARIAGRTVRRPPAALSLYR